MAFSTNPFITLDEVQSTVSDETNYSMIDMSLNDSLKPFIADEVFAQSFSDNSNTSYGVGCDNSMLFAPHMMTSPNPAQLSLGAGNANNRPMHLSHGSVQSPHVANNDNSFGVDSQVLAVKREAEALCFTDEKLRCDYIIRRLQMLNKTNDNTCTVQSPKIKMTTWKTDVESWEVFIHKFERYASDLKWDESSKLLHLVSCLEGKALAIYRRIDNDKVATYDELRRELEKAFSLTAVQLGMAFNSATKKSDETATQFAANLKEKFVNWYRKANDCHNMNTDGLLNHVIREQFIKSLPTQCRQQIKQHKLINMDEVAQYAENYFEAYQNECKLEEKKPQVKTANIKPLTNNSSTDNKDYRCRKCKTDKHWYTECPNKKAMVTAAATTHFPSDLASKNKRAEASSQVTESSVDNVRQKPKVKGNR